MKATHTGVTLAGLLMFAPLPLLAKPAPLLHEMFQDHAVLQRDQPIPVWGDAPPGERLTVSLDAGRVETRADENGHWHATLPARPAGGPYVLNVAARSGGTQSIADILLGDVFLCSGQSNMEFPVSKSLNAEAEIAAAKQDTIRLLTVAHDSAAAPRAHFMTPVTWVKTTPATVAEFSAACFYFARELQKSEPIPLGLIHASWAGSRIEPWMGATALRAVGGFEAGLDLLQRYARDPKAGNAAQGAAWERWWHEHDRSEPWKAARGTWADVPEPMRDWKTWGVAELKDHDGMVWFRRDVALTAQQAAANATLSIGGIDEVDETWVNGTPIGYSFGYGTERSYPVPPGLLHAGANSIVINVLSVYGAAGMYGPPEHLALHFQDLTSVALGGQWRYQPVPDIGIPPRAPWDPVGGMAAVHNAMISPLLPYGLKGVLWYQGESNAGEAARYRSLLPALMQDWRREFAAPLPFLVVQLPDFGKRSSLPTESSWANLREVQRRVVLGDSRAALAVTIDLGDPQELHPPNKQAVGTRLARAALHLIYARSVTPSGPVPRGATPESDRVAVSFDDIDGGLQAISSNRVIGFELCTAAEGSCRFVDATIAGDRVLLDASSVAGATRVRFCWADSPLCNLVDESGLPAGPFELTIRQ
jgi:sialate O-acetylesterase